LTHAQTNPRSLANLKPFESVHGFARVGAIHPLHRVWRQMLQRCENPRDPRFLSYGGRGIGVCARWRDFIAFLADVGPRPEGVGPGGRALYSLDRIDNDGDYEPGNVRWSTTREQARNATYNRRLTLRGETLLLCEWAERLRVTPVSIHNRIKGGMSVEEALTKPFRSWGPRGRVR
jgi:hypothetical protein